MEKLLADFLSAVFLVIAKKNGMIREGQNRQRCLAYVVFYCSDISIILLNLFQHF